MSVLSMVQSAMKAKSPWVGIPIEGRAPFIVRRDLLVESLKGLTITEAAIQMPCLNVQPYLQIFAEAGKVKAVRKFWNHPNVWDKTNHGRMHCASTANADWAVKERERLAKPKLKGAAKKLYTLKAKLASMTPVPTAISARHAWDNYLAEPDQWIEWRESKRTRQAFKSKEAWEDAKWSDAILAVNKPHRPTHEPEYGPQRYERVKEFLHSDECLHLKAMIEAVSNQLTN